MARIYLLLSLAACLSGAPYALSATRVERGNLIYDNIPEPNAELAERLDAYLNARQATPLGFSPQGQLLIATRFGDVDQLHLVERPGGERRQLTFLREPVTKAAFSPIPAAVPSSTSRTWAGTRMRSCSTSGWASLPPGC